MSTTPSEPLRDEDMTTVGGSAPRDQRDADSTDADADTPDADTVDSTDADADSTDNPA